MNPWLLTAGVVMASLVPCADMCLRGSPERRFAGLQMGGTLVIIAMVLLTVGFGQSPFIDLPLALTVMGFGGGLVYARFLEKHL